MSDAARWSPGQLAQIACLAEVTAPKAGNVHPGASFADVTWMDFALSAIAAAPALDRAARIGVGASVLQAVQATRAAIGGNTNLGMLLLLAPLCAVAADEPLERGLPRVLAGLTAADARDVFAAIRLANPGGLGRVERGDVHDAPNLGLLEAMALAAGRDAIARQYVNGFAQVLGVIAPRLIKACRNGRTLQQAIVLVHLEQMADEPDSLIRRKCGEALATESAQRARAVLEAGWPDAPRGVELFAELDAFLRADGNHRNPGTSADLLAAGIFAACRQGELKVPWRW